MTVDENRQKDAPRGWRRFWHRLVHNEEGALIILSLQLFILMLVSTGIAIDLVRVEERRATVQNTLDRAVLAAASLTQKRDAKLVVKDYLQKAGLGYIDVEPTVEGDLDSGTGAYRTWKRVTIRVKDDMPTIFGPLIGVDSLRASSASQAIESVGNVEISLVLDISGSMDDVVYGGATRMDKLKSAAKGFVTQMFDNVQPPGAPAGRLSISVVPYNQQVSLGATLAKAYTLTDPGLTNPGQSTEITCADVTELGTSSLGISSTTPLQRTMKGDSFDRYTWNVVTTFNCPEYPYAGILAFANNAATIKSKIDSLKPLGDTAIDVGARWGLALLDPEAQTALTTLKNAGAVSPDLAGRPLAYDDGTMPISKTSMKVLVLMTDGENTRTYSTKPLYRTGPSPFFSTRNSTDFDLADKSRLYYRVTARTSSDNYYRFSDGNWTTKPLNAFNISWETIWSKGYTLKEVVDGFLFDPRRKQKSSILASSIYDEMAIQSEYASKDAALAALCTTAKAASRKIRIFTVAVDAKAAGAETVLKNCATADTYFYKVDANDLQTAFASIATAINSLRLSN